MLERRGRAEKLKNFSVQTPAWSWMLYLHRTWIEEQEWRFLPVACWWQGGLYDQEPYCRPVVSCFTFRHYFSKISEKGKETDTFYCRPLDKYRDDGPWYSVQPWGKHALNKMVKNMCNEAGLNGNFMNHSLRASGATQLFQNNVPEVIQEVTGHRSTKALRLYERVAIQQKQVASNILTSGSSSKELHPQQSFQAPKGNVPGPPSFGFPMPVFSPVFSGHAWRNS